MIKLLIRLFIKDNENTKNNIVREKYAYLSGILGIICNFVLFFVKVAVGFIIGSIAIISDSFNNFSDMGTSVITIIGTKLSNAHADSEHPFGHGRAEYVSSLIVSFIIILVGFELFKTSFGKILNPEIVTISLPLTFILLVSVLIKVWMFQYNKYIGKKINSGVILAVASDSINDVFSTLAVIIATFLGSFFKISLDGYAGAAVSLFIMFSGYKLSKKTIDTLLGTSPDPEMVKNIEKIIMENEGILGIHDLIVHDYGPGRIMASLHAEVPEDCDIVKIHELIDHIENYIEKNLGIHIVIHMDPVATSSEKINELKSFIESTLYEVDKELSFHDFRITDGENNINMIFDLCVPISYKEYQRKNIVDVITKKVKERDDKYNLVIKIDNKF